MGIQDELLFKTANEEALEALSDNGRNGPQVDFNNRIRVKADMSGSHKLKIWAMGSSSALPNASSPTSEGTGE